MRTRAHISLASVFVVVVSAVAWLPVDPAYAQTYMLGIDVSHWQEENGHVINWQKVAESGQAFAWHKATEGSTYSDPRYAGNRTDAANVGIPFGAYHFARPNGGTISAAQNDAIEEAQYLLATAQPASGDLIPVLDLESSGGLPVRRLTAWVQAWLDTVVAGIGVKPMIYSGPNFWETNLDNTATFAEQGFPLWVAHYTSAAAPRTPGNNWNGQGWSFWQFTSQATIPGIQGNVDQDRFSGTDLAPYKIPGAPLPQPTPDPATPPVNQSPPTVSGQTEVGERLTASQGTWAGSTPQSYTYGWSRCDADGLGCAGIVEGTGPTYDLKPADFGHRLKVTVTATNSAGSAASDSELTAAVTDSVAPTSPQLTAPSSPRTLAAFVRVAWRSTEAGVDAFDARYRKTTLRAGFGGFVDLVNDSTESQSNVDVERGAMYCFSVRAIDEAGNRSEWSGERCTSIALDDRDLGAGPAWTRVHADGSYLGTLTKTDKTEASVVLNNVRVKDLYVIAQRCPGCGSLAVLFDGRRVDTIRLAARRSQSRVVIKVAGFSATRTGDIKLRVISSGAPVKIDGLVLLTIS